MFLNRLQDINKELFLELCVHAALSNGIFADEQKQMISAYCHEMNIEERIPEMDNTFDELLKQISLNTSEEEKNIIVLEIFGLIKSDNIYDEKEQLFMKSLVDGINVDKGILSRIHSLLEIYKFVCKELYKVISE